MATVRYARPGNFRYIGDNRTYMRNLATHFDHEYERHRTAENVIDSDRVESPENLPLNVEITEFYARDNAQTHHTDLYELTQMVPATPVLRRGQTFFMAMRFDRVYDNKKDSIKLIFNFGPNPAVSKGTRVIIPVTDQPQLSADKRRWDVMILRQDGTTLTFEVQVPPSAKVGLWRCVLRTDRLDQKVVKKDFNCPEDVYILFNPWCKEDAVYVDNDALREECVLNDVGKVWMGSARNPRGHRWIYGQFDDVILPVVSYLLELSNLPPVDRGSPVHVTRAISTVINANDEGGLLVGKWWGNFNYGTPPTAWTGSIAIMEQYLNSGWRPVRYGQCWVFSALVVTVCRALGIPCRSVTNYVSAHDTNRSLTVDKYFRRDGEEIYGGPDGNCRDSCWNFHVWNEVWMARPDLPSGYGGWQIIDATPQEESDGKYRVGPASLEAVRRGQVGFSFDTPFVFAEVNADLCHFQESDESDWGFAALFIDHYHVGRRIVTKIVGKDDDEGDADLEDITHLYKDPDGSQAERLAVMNAVRGNELAERHYGIPKKQHEDVTFDLVEIDNIAFGQSFSVTVHIHNKSDEPRTISCVLSANSVYYNGTTASRLKKAHGEFVVQPQQRETLRIQVNPAEYLEKLVIHSLVKIYAIANVKETQQTWSEEDDFPLVKPKLSIQVRDEVQVGQSCPAVFSFQNPLPTVLTDCCFWVEGPGLQRPKVVPYKDVKPAELVSFTEYFIPKRVGQRKLVCTFNSKQLSGIAGSCTVSVTA
ncbi:hemocyte protein-glutamine gamma-glutamyltransferase [Anabrus simplex]|uniref:hemocyte protein-glutamine gamma-glutamyltransferase n=1 Tax=Anabrus simplex TaxID=316456 RepID=UPI0035A2DE90